MAITLLNVFPEKNKNIHPQKDSYTNVKQFYSQQPQPGNNSNAHQQINGHTNCSIKTKDCYLLSRPKKVKFKEKREFHNFHWLASLVIRPIMGPWYHALIRAHTSLVFFPAMHNASIYSWKKKNQTNPNCETFYKNI